MSMSRRNSDSDSDLESATPLLVDEEGRNVAISYKSPRLSHPVLIALVCAAILSVAYLWTPIDEDRSTSVLGGLLRLAHPPPPPDLLAYESIPIPCPRSLQRELNDPGAWILAATLDPLVWEVSPQRAVPQACVSSTVFSARLVGGNSTWANYTRALPWPARNKGVYMVRVAGGTAEVGWDVRLEVYLEFGVFEGSMLDGDGDSRSGSGREIQTISPSMRYVGKEITGSGATVVLDARKMRDPSKIRTYCTSYAPLEGAWIGTKFVPDTCDFHPLPSTDSSPDSPIWINMIGDSNMRNILIRYALQLGYTNCAQDLADGPYPTAFACTRPDSLSIITYSMWYTKGWIGEGEHAILDGASRLEEGIAWDLATTLGENHLQGKVPKDVLSYWTTDRRPLRTYVSLGTHATTMTNRGAKDAVALLFNSTSLHDPSLRFLPTTPVNVKYVKNGWIDQEILQNNVLIEARNQWLLRAAPVEKVIDIWGLTVGIWEDRMRKMDAVHWSEEVYLMIGRILHSEMIEGEKRDRSSSQE